MSKTNTIKPLDGFSKVPDAVVVSRGTAVQTHMTGNSNFPNPPLCERVTLLAVHSSFDVADVCSRVEHLAHGQISLLNHR